jgi:L-threonylcarbamoyladenylate synthase
MLKQAVAALRRGEVVCFPTETTYGLAADIGQRVALERLVALKGRGAATPFGLIVADADSAASLARVWPMRARELAERHWPGPLTLVVPARADLPAEIVGPGGGVGVRVSSHPLAAALVRELGGPITATSANPAGGRPALSVEEARAFFGDRVAVYLDGGPAAEATASTVVEIVAEGSIRVVRCGVIPVEDGGTTGGVQGG